MDWSELRQSEPAATLHAVAARFKELSEAEQNAEITAALKFIKPIVQSATTIDAEDARVFYRAMVETMIAPPHSHDTARAHLRARWTRPRLMAELDKAIAHGARAQADKAKGQGGLFD